MKASSNPHNQLPNASFNFGGRQSTGNLPSDNLKRNRNLNAVYQDGRFIGGRNLLQENSTDCQSSNFSSSLTSEQMRSNQFYSNNDTTSSEMINDLSSVTNSIPIRQRKQDQSSISNQTALFVQIDNSQKNNSTLKSSKDFVIQPSNYFESSNINAALKFNPNVVPYYPQNGTIASNFNKNQDSRFNQVDDHYEGIEMPFGQLSRLTQQENSKQIDTRNLSGENAIFRQQRSQSPLYFNEFSFDNSVSENIRKIQRPINLLNENVEYFEDPVDQNSMRTVYVETANDPMTSLPIAYATNPTGKPPKISHNAGKTRECVKTTRLIRCGSKMLPGVQSSASQENGRLQNIHSGSQTCTQKTSGNIAHNWSSEGNLRRIPQKSHNNYSAHREKIRQLERAALHTGSLKLNLHTKSSLSEMSLDTISLQPIGPGVQNLESPVSPRRFEETAKQKEHWETQSSLGRFNSLPRPAHQMSKILIPGSSMLAPIGSNLSSNYSQVDRSYSYSEETKSLKNVDLSIIQHINQQAGITDKNFRPPVPTRLVGLPSYSHTVGSFSEKGTNGSKGNDEKFTFRKVSQLFPPDTEENVCEVLYLGSTDVFPLEGSAGLCLAVDKILTAAYDAQKGLIRKCIAEARITQNNNLVIHDNTKVRFDKKTILGRSLVYCQFDPNARLFNSPELSTRGITNSRIFGISVKKKRFFMTRHIVYVMCEVPTNQANKNFVKFVQDNFLVGKN